MLTNIPPTKIGHYWWTDGHERLQIVEVVESNGQLWAQNEEVSFNIKETCGDEDLWEFIKRPKLPKRKNLTDEED